MPVISNKEIWIRKSGYIKKFRAGNCGGSDFDEDLGKSRINSDGDIIENIIEKELPRELKDFGDADPANRHFVHTFKDLPPCIYESILEVDIRPLEGKDTGSVSDIIALGSYNENNQPPTYKGGFWFKDWCWYRYIGNYVPAIEVEVLKAPRDTGYEKGIFDVPWEAPNKGTIKLDLSALPMRCGLLDLTCTLNKTHCLNVYIQDDSIIDCIRLTVTSICPDT